MYTIVSAVSIFYWKILKYTIHCIREEFMGIRKADDSVFMMRLEHLLCFFVVNFYSYITLDADH